MEIIKKSIEKIIYCERCDDDSICNPKGVGCPRGSCEAEVVGFVEITKRYIIKVKNHKIIDYFNKKYNK